MLRQSITVGTGVIPRGVSKNGGVYTDLTPERKEPLLVNFVQIGIDLGGMIRAGQSR